MKKGIRAFLLLPLLPFALAWRTARVYIRRWRIRYDFTKHTPEEHPGLKKFSDGELLPLKGIEFRVVARYTDPAPVLILEPRRSTRNAMLNRLRTLRREDRIEQKTLRTLRSRAARRAQEAPRVDQ